MDKILFFKKIGRYFWEF